MSCAHRDVRLSPLFHQCVLTSSQQVPVSCPWSTELSQPHCQRMPHAGKQLPKDEEPQYRVEKGKYNKTKEGPHKNRRPGIQTARPGWPFRPPCGTWLQPNSMCQGQGATQMSIQAGPCHHVWLHQWPCLWKPSLPLSCLINQHWGLDTGSGSPYTRPKSCLGPNMMSSVHGQRQE